MIICGTNNHRSPVAQRWVRCVCGLTESQMVWAGLLHILFGWSSSVPWIFHSPPGTRGLKGECSIVVMAKVPKSNKSQRGPCITQALLKLDSELAHCSCCFIQWPKKVTWTKQSQCVEKHTDYLYRKDFKITCRSAWIWAGWKMETSNAIYLED